MEIPSLLPLIPLLENNYSIVCHTNAEKIICIDFACTLTCARCTGIYFGALILSILFVLGIRIKVSLKYLILSSIPIFVDITLYSLGIYEYSIFIGLTTGILLGSVGFIYIRNVLFDYLNKT